MKIATISTSIFRLPVSGYSGLEHLAWQISKGLAAKGHQVSVIAPEGSTCPGCTIIPCGPAGTWNEQQAFNSYWPHLLDQDCIIDHTWNKNSMMLKMEGRLKAPILSVMHAPVDTMYKELPPGVEKPCFVCISEDQRSHFEALFNHPARTAYNGVNTSYYSPINIPRSDRFLFLARFSTIKGPDLAISACKQVGVGLDLVGDVSITNEPELYQRCQRECDEEQIRMVGPATRAECVWWFSQAHCLLHPNLRFREPLGLAPLEAQACECPVVAWRNGAMKETVLVGETGFLVNTLEEMIERINQVKDGISDVMRKRCREWASQFSEEKMVNRYEQLCYEALDGGW
ncbi:MAG: glycosyltransferase [Patescibacteria group bacterium]|nr:glycosyltransferase [Patescibacteria group bacterium]